MTVDKSPRSHMLIRFAAYHSQNCCKYYCAQALTTLLDAKREFTVRCHANKSCTTFPDQHLRSCCWDQRHARVEVSSLKVKLCTLHSRASKPNGAWVSPWVRFLSTDVWVMLRIKLIHFVERKCTNTWQILVHSIVSPTIYLRKWDFIRFGRHTYHRHEITNSK